jgi:arginine/lysine/ornithine decarboxylase
MPSFDKPLQTDVEQKEVYSTISHVSGETTFVDICNADGYICANQCGGYPPCIPLFLHGEKITNANRLLAFADTFGLFDNKIKVFKK